VIGRLVLGLRCEHHFVDGVVNADAQRLDRLGYGHDDVFGQLDVTQHVSDIIGRYHTLVSTLGDERGPFLVVNLG
jgi:hypothetical protein